MKIHFDAVVTDCIPHDLPWYLTTLASSENTDSLTICKLTWKYPTVYSSDLLSCSEAFKLLSSYPSHFF